MSTTTINQDTAVINSPKNPTTGIMNQLNSLYNQNLSYSEGDDQVQHTSSTTDSSSSTPSSSGSSSQNGGRAKTYKVKQMGGKKKGFSIQAKNMHEAAEKGFLQINAQHAYFTLEGGKQGDRKSFCGCQKKNGQRTKNIIQEL